MAGGTDTTVQQQPTLGPEQREILGTIAAQIQRQLGQPEAPWAGQAASVFESLLGGGLPESFARGREDLFNQAIVQPQQRMMEEVVMPQLKASYAGPGGNYWTGPRMMAEQKAWGDWTNALSAQRAAFETSEQQRQIGNVQTGVGMLQQQPQWARPEQASGLQRGMSLLGTPTLENIAQVQQQPNYAAPLGMVGGAALGSLLMPGPGTAAGGAAGGGLFGK